MHHHDAPRSCVIVGRPPRRPVGRASPGVVPTAREIPSSLDKSGARPPVALLIFFCACWSRLTRWCLAVDGPSRRVLDDGPGGYEPIAAEPHVLAVARATQQPALSPGGRPGGRIETRTANAAVLVDDCTRRGLRKGPRHQLKMSRSKSDVAM